MFANADIDLTKFSPGPQGEPGLAGISGYEQVVFAYATGVANGNGGLGPIGGGNCPPGKKVLSISYEIKGSSFGPPTFVPYTLRPFDDNTVTVRFMNIGSATSSGSMEITLICAVVAQ